MKASTAGEVPSGHIFLSPGMDLAKFDSAKELQKPSRRAKMRSMCRRVIQSRWGLPRCGLTDSEGRGLQTPRVSHIPKMHCSIFRKVRLCCTREFCRKHHMKKLVLIFLCQLLRRNSTYSVHWILSAPINTGGVFCWGTDLLIGVDQIHLFFSFKPVLHVELLG